jgi:molybdopterin molybdotransferase
MRRNGIELLFEKVAIKPGKPTVFGRTERTAVFGLPGNPVSTLTLFEILVKPFLFKMMGHDERPIKIVMPLEQAVTLKAADRQTWIPVVLSERGGVVPVDFHGSAHILALCRADGLIAIPRGVTHLPAGTPARVRRI